MSVAWARNKERQASNPRRPGTWSSTSRSKSSAVSVWGTICMCTYLVVRYVQAQAYRGQPPQERSDAVSTQLQIDLDPSIRRVFGIPAGEAGVRRAKAALEANGIRVLRAADASEAKRIVLSLIPDGSQVHHGASESLEVAGITEEIESSG